MNDKELEKLFSEQLKDAEATPPTEIWAHITAELDRSDKQVLVIRKRSWLKYAALFVFALGATLLWYLRPAESLIEQDTLAQLSTEVPQEAITALKPVLDKAAAAIPEERKNLTANLLSHPKGATQLIKTTPTALLDEPEARLVKTKKLVLPKVTLASVSLERTAHLAHEKLIKRKVVEVEPIRPLIDLEEVEETMLASKQLPPNQNIVSGILNKLSNALNTDEQKVLRISHDEEGSFHIDINNSFAKNRFKRKK